MKIKQQIELAALASILLLGSMITISIIYLEGVPLYLSLVAGTAGILLSTFFLVRIHRSLTRGIGRILTISQDIAQGTLDSSGKAAAGNDELGQLAQSFYTLGIDLHHKTEEERSLRLKAEEQAWINTEVSEMALMLQGSVHLQTAARIFIGRLASAVGGSYGAVYMVQHNQLQFKAGYAFDEASVNLEPFGLGSGLVGQCAVDRQMIVMHNLPENYIRVHSGLGEAVPSTLILLPVLYETEVVAVVELALMKELADKELQLIERTGQNMGVLINTLAHVARIEELLSETQMQKDELEAQTEELQAQTQELEAQTEELLAQTEELQAQTKELATSNNNLQQQMELTARQKEEIQEQADALLAQTNELQDQKEELQAQTQELLAQTEELAVSNSHLQQQMKLTEQQKAEIKAQAEEIFMAAQYKSEFLANVSHELRTPLNSLLILSQILAENKEGNLGVKQLEYVHTIFSAGKDLLQLIDEILDLAKLEVGKMTPVLEPVALHDVSTHLFRRFEQQAKKKNIRFDVHCDSRLPEHLMTDGHRLQQIINNLLSNALKFTPEQGSVSLSIRPSSDEVIFSVSD
ncbi:histidine kinase dimerization/phospho-acceptor domain-containing protein, partial [Paenibacillus ihuae]|uniref:histidine kinase dimerization/phospho-acceptor domain-containing protein n=1 Tax=Paenibacillus ihuae TaxID=1232431 RepID=UPI001AE00636